MALIRKSSRCFILALVLFTGLLALTSSPSLAGPYLQLDIAGGTYDAATQTIVAPGDHFTLYAYMSGALLDDPRYTYYISAALMNNDPKQGSFIFNSLYFNTEYNWTAQPGKDNVVDFAKDIYVDYGVPPHYDPNGQGYDDGDLALDGIFPTYFKEFKVVFNKNSQIAPYDTMTRTGDISLTGSGMYYATFDVNTSGLLPGNAIHFDLYTVVATTNRSGVTTDLDVQYFALNDAESLDPPPPVPCPSVPDASIMFLLGPSLVGLGLLGRRKLVK
jgi:hypothetical protein